MISGAPQERNQEATIYIGNLDPMVTEELLWELFVQCGPVHNVYIPRDRITQQHSGYGFVEFKSEQDSDYAQKVMNMIALFGRPLKINRAAQDKSRIVDVGANLFVGNLDPLVDEKLLYDTFSVMGTITQPIRIMQDSTRTKCYAFVNYDNFDSSDAAIRTMDGQWLGGRQITVQYAYKKDSKKKERHGTEEERLLAANKPMQMTQQQQHQHAGGMVMGMGGMNMMGMTPMSYGAQPPMMYTMPTTGAGINALQMPLPPPPPPPM